MNNTAAADDTNYSMDNINRTRKCRIFNKTETHNESLNTTFDGSVKPDGENETDPILIPTVAACLSFLFVFGLIYGCKERKRQAMKKACLALKNESATIIPSAAVNDPSVSMEMQPFLARSGAQNRAPLHSIPEAGCSTNVEVILSHTLESLMDQLSLPSIGNTGTEDCTSSWQWKPIDGRIMRAMLLRMGIPSRQCTWTTTNRTGNLMEPTRMQDNVVAAADEERYSAKIQDWMLRNQVLLEDGQQQQHNVP